MLDMVGICYLFLHVARGRRGGLIYTLVDWEMALCGKVTICGLVWTTDHDDTIYGM